MDTAVSIEVPSGAVDRVAAAFDWFGRVEIACSRFDPSSELRRLCTRIGEPVRTSAVLFQAIRFALVIAEESGGAFDPTVGGTLERQGFNRNYRTGEMATGALDADRVVSFRDVHVDADAQTITLDRPLVLDLGAVAKGLAIDMAAHELRDLRNYAIDAGGDLYLAGVRPDGAPWSVGIRNPRPTGDEDRLVETLSVSDLAVCTSGDYARPRPDGAPGHHIVDPRRGTSSERLASVTVVASSAMVADAVATAAFVLGPSEGLRLCESLAVDALMLSPTCERYATRGMLSGQYRTHAALLPNPEGTADDRPHAAGGRGGGA